MAGDRHEARSAGSDPGERVHPEVVEVMRELGIDLANRVPHLLDRADAEWADVVVTMGCGDACPYIPGKRYVDWDLRDPKGLPLDEVRAIRDDIRTRVERLVAELDLAATIRTERLDLVLLDRAWLQAYADGKPLPDLGFADPDGILAGSAELVGGGSRRSPPTPPRSRGSCGRSSSATKAWPSDTSTSTRRPTSVAWSRSGTRSSRRAGARATRPRRRPGCGGGLPSTERASSVPRSVRTMSRRSR